MMTYHSGSQFSINAHNLVQNGFSHASLRKILSVRLENAYAHSGDRSLVRRGTGPKGHWSESYIVVRSGGGESNPAYPSTPLPVVPSETAVYRSGVRTLDSYWDAVAYAVHDF